MKTVETEGFVIKGVVVHETDGPVAGVAGIDNGLDWVDGITEVDDGVDQVDGIAGVANRVDIHRVIDFS